MTTTASTSAHFQSTGQRTQAVSGIVPQTPSLVIPLRARDRVACEMGGPRLTSRPRARVLNDGLTGVPATHRRISGMRALVDLSTPLAAAILIALLLSSSGCGSSGGNGGGASPTAPPTLSPSPTPTGASSPCSATADALFGACGNGVQDDRGVAEAICINVSDDTERGQCVTDADAARDEAEQLCNEQLTGRRNACTLLGEGRYDPDLNPDGFDDDFTSLTKPNPYFPLTIGHRWEFHSGDEVNTVEVV